MQLTLEVNKAFVDKQPVYQGPAEKGKPAPPVMLVTPPIGEDYWLFRVKVSDKQAIIGFPKFFTIGIGFAVEDADWNTNLPYTCDAKRILDHIQANKGSASIPDALCLAAIELVQQAAAKWKQSEADAEGKLRSAQAEQDARNQAGEGKEGADAP